MKGFIIKRLLINKFKTNIAYLYGKKYINNK